MNTKQGNDAEEKKQPMTHEERVALCAKLDKELDDFIESLPKKRYEDGWPEDRWEEEMAKHPFFMTKEPEPGAELHPLYEGLQKLKYDPDENEPEELATSYKEDGNYNFKYKNYRLAILSYTEGIKIKCGNADLEGSLLNNRAAAHYFLKNYRSSLADCKLALKINPNYPKVLMRAANCCFAMRKYDEAIQFCDKLLDKDKDNAVALELRKKALIANKQKQRDERKRDLEIGKKEKEEEELIQIILNRGVNFECDRGKLTLKSLEPCIPELVHNRVHVINDELVWPVVFLYPEYKIMDYIQEFNENQRFIEQLYNVFEHFPEWDQEKKYKPDNLVVYFESYKKKVIKIDINKTLGDVLKMKEYIVRAGTPSFIILVKDSAAEKRFLQEY